MSANLLDFDLEGMAAFCESLGEKRFRATQLFRWIHQRGAKDFDAMSDLARWKVRGPVRTLRNEHAEWDPSQDTWRAPRSFSTVTFRHDGQVSDRECHNPDGSAVDISHRVPWSRQLRQPEDARLIADYSRPDFVLAGWKPKHAAAVRAVEDISAPETARIDEDERNLDERLSDPVGPA